MEPNSTMNFLGVDVGFSALSLTTGLAWRVGDHIGATKTGTSWSKEERGSAIGHSLFNRRS